MNLDLTISQALRRISKLKGQLAELLQRAAGAVTYFDKEPPAFAFAASLEQAEAVRGELITLETALRVTNAQTRIDYLNRKVTLAEATCILQETKGRIAWLRGLGVQPQADKEHATVVYDPLQGKQVYAVRVSKCDLPEAQRAAAVQREQEAFDTLNDLVENINHRTPLVCV